MAAGEGALEQHRSVAGAGVGAAGHILCKTPAGCPAEAGVFLLDFSVFPIPKE